MDAVSTETDAIVEIPIGEEDQQGLPFYLTEVASSFIEVLRSPFVCVFCGVGGWAVAAVSVATLGQWKWANHEANRLIGKSCLATQELFIGLLGMLNPWAKVEYDEITRCGFLASAGGKMLTWIENQTASDKNSFERHISSRSSFFARHVAMTFLRFIDLPIGLVTAVVSIGTLGYFPKVNTVAARGLSGFRAFTDIHHAAVGMVSPTAKGFAPY